MQAMKTTTPHQVRRHWIEGREIVLIDVREEGPYSTSHPLFAVSIPLSELEARLPALIPRNSAPIVVYDSGEGYVARAVPRIQTLGYTDVSILRGGLAAYAREGEVYRDVNVPSKAFGELVEAIRHTPSLPARDVKHILDTREDVVVVDARRFEEFHTMSIPRGRSCPGGELAYRIREAAPSPETLVIVNCAGRTRSIIGTQSLINAGVPNRVLALRNGTIGWTLEGLDVERGKTERLSTPSRQARDEARESVERWAKHVGVQVINAETLSQFRQEAHTRTLYTLDVRDPEEYQHGHPAGFLSAPGGQLVQATDEWIGVRGARIVLYDDDGIRALMTATWLQQMGWNVYVLEQNTTLPETVSSAPGPIFHPDLPHSTISATELKNWPDATIIDLARSPAYTKGHIPGAYFASGPELARDLQKAPGSGPIILTSPDGIIAAANLPFAKQATSRPVKCLSEGTAGWTALGYPLETETRWLSEPIDVYKRPYEGTNNARESMQSYIDWELQLVAQLANDGVAGFHVVRAAE
ncbi:Rhodanese-like domain-containing protein [Neohortaea acidophila]|uniref:Rhodanese-like domain-containing protein n=1 Tax=Neohortaea acidophila TaxID=245834 RepID=A0A6A6PTV2_9PEZI|nr:Rhodanese-like domain-containing protein [Neohortaea acidophila]KAF2482893.1 Rhodanese-like domain-containing protein [Neohortaea acidophila]